MDRYYTPRRAREWTAETVIIPADEGPLPKREHLGVDLHEWEQMVGLA
jgi:hypothetical protein